MLCKGNCLASKGKGGQMAWITVFHCELITDPKLAFVRVELVLPQVQESTLL